MLFLMGRNEHCARAAWMDGAVVCRRGRHPRAAGWHHRVPHHVDAVTWPVCGLAETDTISTGMWMGRGCMVLWHHNHAYASRTCLTVVQRQITSAPCPGLGPGPHRRRSYRRRLTRSCRRKPWKTPGSSAAPGRSLRLLTSPTRGELSCCTPPSAHSGLAQPCTVMASCVRLAHWILTVGGMPGHPLPVPSTW